MALEINAQSREAMGRKTNALRKTGEIPAVLYGHNKKTASVSVGANQFDKIFKQAGETTLVDLVLDGKKHKVLIREVAREAVSGNIIHVDFFEVKLDEKIKTKVPLIFVGEAPAVRAEGGVLVKAVQEVELEALPQDLPKEIAVDISSLVSFENKIHVKDLKVAGSVKILADGEETITFVAPPRSDKEMEELEQKPVAEVGEVEVVGEKKKEEAMAQEAAAPENTQES